MLRTPPATRVSLSTCRQVRPTLISSLSLSVRHTHLRTPFLPRRGACLGTYRITQTLRIVKILGGAIIGHGETSVLQWAGAQGGILLHDGGVTRTRFVGLVFDGQGIAGVGFGARVARFRLPIMSQLLNPRGGPQSTTPDAPASMRRASGTRSTSSRTS